MQIKTILNRVYAHRGFVYSGIVLTKGVPPTLLVTVTPRKGSLATCSGCDRKGPGYDTLAERRFQFVPLWGIAVFLLYAMRRVDCRRCGVTVEKVPWGNGKNSLTTAFAYFLAGWAKRMSWAEVARSFTTSWENVFRSVDVVVAWGLAHRRLDDVKAIGIDEVLWHRGYKFLTVVYQMDERCKRLLWVGRDRTIKTTLRFFHSFGKERSAALQFICSDMWKPYLKVIAKKAGQAVHVLDRFHIMAKFNLAELVRHNLRAVRSHLLREEFQLFWTYSSPAWAGKFLDLWCTKTMRSQIEPMKKIARTLRTHKPLILNWFRAKGLVSTGAVEGLHNKLKVITRRSFGFRTYRATEIALYHALGDLPNPASQLTHRFC